MSDEQKKSIVGKLNEFNQKFDIIEENKQYTVQEFENFIEAADWGSLLLPKDRFLTFNFTIALKNPKKLLKSIEGKANNLFLALENNKDCIIKVTNINEKNTITFTTSVSQESTWSIEFTPNTPGYWQVHNFKLSTALETKISEITEGSTEYVGAFKIKKGTAIKNLYIIEPNDKKLHHETSILELPVTSGIYDAFLQLENFYGIPQVDKVKTTLSNEVKFSQQKVTATQTQAVQMIAQSCSINPTEIYLEQNLHIWLDGIKIGTSLDLPNVAGKQDNQDNSNNADGTDYYIELEVEKKNSKVSLYPYNLTPEQAVKILGEFPQQDKKNHLWSDEIEIGTSLDLSKVEGEQDNQDNPNNADGTDYAIKLGEKKNAFEVKQFKKSNNSLTKYYLYGLLALTAVFIAILVLALLKIALFGVAPIIMSSIGATITGSGSAFLFMKQNQTHQAITPRM
jgi:hypothetical protein